MNYVLAVVLAVFMLWNASEIAKLRSDLDLAQTQTCQIGTFENFIEDLNSGSISKEDLLKKWYKARAEKCLAQAINHKENNDSKNTMELTRMAVNYALKSQTPIENFDRSSYLHEEISHTEYWKKARK